MLLYNCTQVEINRVTIIVPEGNAGMYVVNVRDYSKIINVIIAIQVCPSVDKNAYASQANGILLYYDNWKNPYNKSSEIHLDNIKFTINGSCSYPPIRYVITLLIFQNNTNVSVVIQDIVLENLRNVSALYYYGETCGISAINSLTIRNFVISKNTGNCNFTMFHMVLYNIQCIELIIASKQYYLQQDNHVSFINCTFVHNSDMMSMIYVSPASSRATTGHFYLENNIFRDNRNTHFFIMNSDADNIWQLSNYVTINNTNVTSNVHDGGQNLMSFTNSWVAFFGSIQFRHNHYYINIWKFHLSIGIFYYNISILNNTVRKILSGSFIFIRENTTTDLSNNTVYVLVDQDLTHSINSETICTVQFYSNPIGLKNLNVSDLSIHIIMENNVHMTPKYLPGYDSPYNCRWLAGSTFQKARLKAEDVYAKILQTNGNTAISNKVIKRPIPLSICKCVKSSHGSPAEYSSIDCYSPHLGSIFPGQTLTVELIFQKHPVHQLNVPIVVDNAEGNDCSVVDISQLSQIHLNHDCNSYSYTLWPKNRTVKVCELFIGLQGTPETFYVQFKPCPLGFTLQENRKACYCDPVLTFIKSCNLSDETILHPAYSWISAREDNDSNNITYTVSSYCPFALCLSHKSNLKLSEPDSQCHFSRTGLLCGECQQGFSTVFGSYQCKRCSNIYLLLLIPLTLSGIVFVTFLYIFNLTVWNGTVNTCIFYINIISINVLALFSNCQSFACVILSIMAFDFRAKSCFYNGMDDYAKKWLQLAHTFYLIGIAILFIILSRYSTTLQRWTAQKALPVLATLFLFSFTKLLIAVCNVLFKYSTITYLPSNKNKMVWSVSTPTPLFGLKFLALFAVCIIIFLILFFFNLILLFTRTLSRLRFITTFKPLLDTYFGPYKDNAYYWTGLLLLIRVIMYVLLGIDEDMGFVVISILLGVLLCLHAAVQPFKSKFHNIQECITILNLLAVYAALSYKKNLICLRIAKTLITIGVAYFMIAIVFHSCIYRWKTNFTKVLNCFFARYMK